MKQITEQEIKQACIDEGGFFGVEGDWFAKGAKWAISKLQPEPEKQSSPFNIGFQNAGRDIVNPKLQPEWIPITERLPEHNTEVLVTDGIKVKLSWFGRRTTNEQPGFRFVSIEVTGWLPLPSPPNQ
jgi:hypothetical protein